MWDRTVPISSAAKRFSCTGWKVGWAIGPEHLIKAVHFISRTEYWCNPSPLQAAVATMLEKADFESYEGFPNYWLWLKDMYTQKRDKCMKVIENAGLTGIKPEGTFFAVAESSKLVDKLLEKGLIDKEKAEKSGKMEDNIDWQVMGWIATNARVTTIPMSCFTGESFVEPWRFLRFSFCVTDDAFEESAERMKIVKEFLES